MSPEVKRELKTWVQYFVIAFVAEMIAFWNAFVPSPHDGSEFDLKGVIRNQYLDYEQPRLWYWFIAFTVMAAIRISIVYVAQIRKGRL